MHSCLLTFLQFPCKRFIIQCNYNMQLIRHFSLLSTPRGVFLSSFYRFYQCHGCCAPIFLYIPFLPLLGTLVSGSSTSFIALLKIFGLVESIQCPYTIKEVVQGRLGKAAKFLLHIFFFNASSVWVWVIPKFSCFIM